MEEKHYKVLPFTTLLAIIGSFFTIASIVYVFTNLNSSGHQKILIYVIELAVLFFVSLLSFVVVGIKNHKAYSELEANEQYQNCLTCINEKIEKIEDGFHNRGLLYLDELIEYEGKLGDSKNPQDCIVLVYTSDLATEMDAETVVVKNRQAGVRYIVLYFANSCSSEDYGKIKELYGSENLVDLSKIDDYNSSFDGRLATTLGFDLMIYMDSEHHLRGYFAVDFVPEGRPKKRDFHIISCREICNYGKENPKPFYKKISFEIAKQLFDEGMEIHSNILKS